MGGYAWDKSGGQFMLFKNGHNGAQNKNKEWS